MRLSAIHCKLIKQTVGNILKDKATIMLFGSRLDDAMLGGDVDLFIDINYTPDNIALAAANLAVCLERQLDGRKVDVVLRTPISAHQLIYDEIKQYGVIL